MLETANYAICAHITALHAASLQSQVLFAPITKVVFGYGCLERFQRIIVGCRSNIFHFSVFSKNLNAATFAAVSFVFQLPGLHKIAGIFGFNAKCPANISCLFCQLMAAVWAVSQLDPRQTAVHQALAQQRKHAIRMPRPGFNGELDIGIIQLDETLQYIIFSTTTFQKIA